MPSRLISGSLNLVLSGLVAVGLLIPQAARALETPAAPAKPASELEAIDSRFHAFSSRYYAKRVRAGDIPKMESMQALMQSVEAQRRQHQPVQATATVLGNLALVEKNLDTTPVLAIFDLLLETNEWATAASLYQKIRKQGDRSLVSGVSFSLARYHFSRNRWKDTIELVQKLRSDLPPEDYHHAQLLHGISLQQLQKHRPALAVYARIPPTSRYYVAARLNMAIANIRQDWWTDGHLLINELLADKSRPLDTELNDRLYTVLAYSLLKQQYYRNSRDAFRQIGLAGKYSNRALLGIALTAAYQEDFLGALNAAQLLKTRTTRDLPVDEAHLLAPHFQEKMRQFDAAGAEYSQALQYFDARIQSIRAAPASDPSALLRQIVSSPTGVVTLGHEAVDLSDALPRYIFQNVGVLGHFHTSVQQLGDPALSRQLEALENDYGKLLQQTANRLLEEKASHLTHYMNQSRYGLARMQDHDATASK